MNTERRLPRIGNERFRYAAILAKALLLIYEETELEFDDPSVQEMAKQLYNRLWGFIINPEQHKPATEKPITIDVKEPLSFGSIGVEQSVPDGVSNARGRNGYFKPHLVELSKITGLGEFSGGMLMVEMTVYSSRVGETAPIMVRMTQDDWRRVHELLGILIGKED